MSEITYTTKKREVFWYVLLGIAIAAMLVGYGMWSKDQGSEIIIFTSPGAQVFVNGELEGQTGTFKREIKVRKGAGDYSVIVAKDEHWPWMKNISLSLNEKETLRPFLLPRDVKKEQILKIALKGKGTVENPEYAKIISYFNQATIPSEAGELLPELGVENVKSADFYPGRTDALLVSAKNQVFVIEAGEGTPRNFQPLYSGADPTFIRRGETLYVKDGDVLYSIDLSSL